MALPPPNLDNLLQLPPLPAKAFDATGGLGAPSTPPTNTAPIFKTIQRAVTPSDFQTAQSDMPGIINEYVNAQQANQDKSAFLRDIFQQRLGRILESDNQPTQQDRFNTVVNNAQVFAGLPGAQMATPEQMVAKRINTELAPYTSAAKVLSYGGNMSNASQLGGATGVLAQRLMQSDPANFPTLESAIQFIQSGARQQANLKYAADIEAAKTAGKIKGTAQGSLPDVLINANSMLKDLNDLSSYTPDQLGSVYGMRGSIIGAIPGTESMKILALRNKILGKSFLDAYNTLKGGGQITEIEGTKATNAMSTLGERGIKPEDAYAAINDLREVIRNGVIRSKVKAGYPLSDNEQQVYDAIQNDTSNIDIGGNNTPTDDPNRPLTPQELEEYNRLTQGNK